MKKEESRFSDSLVFEGMTSISAVINGGKRKVEKVYYNCEVTNSKQKELSFLKRKSLELSFDLVETDKPFIDSITTGNSHGGIIAECSQRIIEDITALKPVKNGFYVMIEGIEDPYNFGYSIRSIYAAGADGIILSKRNWMSAAGVVCRSSAGASELIDMYVTDSECAIDFFKSYNYKIIAAGIKNSISAFDADLHFPVFLIVGGEKRGISSKILSKCDSIVRLDYGREFKGSLSAASAASILSYEILRQNRKI